MNSRRQVELQPSYVLHHSPYRNTSALIEVLTRDHGRLSLVAKGVRGPRPRWPGQLQPFRPLLVSYTGRTELRNLVGVEADGAVPALNGSVLVSALYLNELMVRMLHRHDPAAELFSHYHDTLQVLATLDDSTEGRVRLEWELRFFELGLLKASGYGLLLAYDAHTGEAIDPDRIYHYEPERGPVRAAGCGSSMQVRGTTLLCLAGQQAGGMDERREAKQLMRKVLAGHLGGKPLFSRRMFSSAMSG